MLDGLPNLQAYLARMYARDRGAHAHSPGPRGPCRRLKPAVPHPLHSPRSALRRPGRASPRPLSRTQVTATSTWSLPILTGLWTTLRHDEAVAGLVFAGFAAAHHQAHGAAHHPGDFGSGMGCVQPSSSFGVKTRLRMKTVCGLPFIGTSNCCLAAAAPCAGRRLRANGEGRAQQQQSGRHDTHGFILVSCSAVPPC